MVEPLTVVALAFSTLKAVANSEPGKKFVEGVIGKVAENFTETAQKKIDRLRQFIVQKLKGNADATTALKEVSETGSETALRDVADYLNMAMRKDEAFTRQVLQLTQEIQQEVNINQMQGGEVWNVVGNAQKNVFSDNKAPIVKDNTGTVHINYGTPPKD